MDNAELQQNETGVGTSQDNSVQLAKAIENAQLLISYTATAGIEVEEEVLNTLIKAKTNSKVNDWSTESEVEFWKAFGQLNQDIQPATVSSVKAIALEPKLSGFRGFLQRQYGRSEARRATTRYTFWTLGILFIVLLFQIYWVIGNSLAAKLTELLDNEITLTNALDQANLGYTLLEVRFKLTEEEGMDGQAGGTYGFYNTPDWERETLETIADRKKMEGRLQSLSVQLERNSAILLRWSTIWQWVVIREDEILGNLEIKEQSDRLDTQIRDAERFINDDGSVQNEIDDMENRLKRLEEDLANLNTELALVIANQLPENQGGTITGTLLVKPIVDQAEREKEIVLAEIEETKSWLGQPDLVKTIKTQRQTNVDTMRAQKAVLDRQFTREATKEKARRVILGTEFALIVLQSYLLPVLYGLLGASVYVLRTMTRDISKVTYSEESSNSLLLRLALGTLAGLIIGWFVFLLPGQSIIGSLSPLALAFLVGYNIEIVFSLMDRLIETFTARPDKDDPRSPTTPGEGQRDTKGEIDPDSPTTA